MKHLLQNLQQLKRCRKERTMTVKTLYEQNPAAWQALAQAGKPWLGQMAKHFTRVHDMNKALGTVNAVDHWIAQRNGATKVSDKKACEWLAANKPTHTDMMVKPETLDAFMEANPLPNDTATYLVVCPGVKARQLERIIALMEWQYERLDV
jgi:hypothetical protein